MVKATVTCGYHAVKAGPQYLGSEIKCILKISYFLHFTGLDLETCSSPSISLKVIELSCRDIPLHYFPPGSSSQGILYSCDNKTIGSDY